MVDFSNIRVLGRSFLVLPRKKGVVKTKVSG